MPGSLVTVDIPYRLLGGGKPTLACTPNNFIAATPQSKDVHCTCLEFTGVNDAARIPVDQDLGFGNAWSVMLWVLPTQTTPLDPETLFEIHSLSNPGDASNSFRIGLEVTGTLVFRMFNTGGGLIKRFDIDSVESSSAGVDGWFFAENWTQIFVTWDGTDFNMYRNGFLMNSAMTTITDINGAQTNTNRSISIGSKVDFTDLFTGFMHSVAYWNEALTQAAIRQIWNQGCGSAFNLFHGVEDYDPRPLNGWYQLGKTIDDPVRDSTNNARHLAAFTVEEILPTGVILPYGSDTPPVGFLLCDGSDVSRSSFAALFTVIGTSYGIGDGATTFNLPNLEGRFPQGRDTGEADFDTLGNASGEKDHVTIEAEMPTHEHGGMGEVDFLSGSWPYGTEPVAGGVGSNGGVDFDNVAWLTSPRGSNAAHNTMSPYVVVNYIIQT